MGLRNNVFDQRNGSGLNSADGYTNTTTSSYTGTAEFGQNVSNQLHMTGFAMHAAAHGGQHLGQDQNTSFVHSQNNLPIPSVLLPPPTSKSYETYSGPSVADTYAPYETIANSIPSPNLALTFRNSTNQRSDDFTKVMSNMDISSTSTRSGQSQQTAGYPVASPHFHLTSQHLYTGSPSRSVSPTMQPKHLNMPSASAHSVPRSAPTTISITTPNPPRSPRHVRTSRRPGTGTTGISSLVKKTSSPVPATPISLRPSPSQPQQTALPTVAPQSPAYEAPKQKPLHQSSRHASLASVASNTSGGSRNSSNLPENVPRVGGVRCYWALLKPRWPMDECEAPSASISGSGSGSTPSSTSSRSELPRINPVDTNEPLSGNTLGVGRRPTRRKRFELDFVHLDPVLSAHMRMQSLSMLGRGVIEFIHPEEREQARRDLYNSTQVNNLEGSVTRVRFARLSRIRTILGCPPEEEDIPTDAYKFVEDDEYLIVDLSLHWACDGLILAFFHACKDKDKDTNNDPKLRHQEWSNYCGTPGFGDEDIEYMWDDVVRALTPPHPILPAAPPERVFLIHATDESAVRPNSVIFAWPPPRIRKKVFQGMDEKVRRLIGGGSMDDDEDEDALDFYGRRKSELVPRMDGSYWTQDYAELMKHVELENKTGREDAWGTFGKTSCTQRFQGGHLLTNEGVWRRIESVFIPYGKITFACFQTVQTLPIAAKPDDSIPKVILPHGQMPAEIPWTRDGVRDDTELLTVPHSNPQLATFSSGPSPLMTHSQPTAADRMARTAALVADSALASDSPVQGIFPQTAREMSPRRQSDYALAGLPVDMARSIATPPPNPRAGHRFPDEGVQPPFKHQPQPQQAYYFATNPGNNQQHHLMGQSSLQLEVQPPVSGTLTPFYNPPQGSAGISGHGETPSVLQPSVFAQGNTSGWSTSGYPPQYIPPVSTSSGTPQLIVSYRDEGRGQKRKADHYQDGGHDVYQSANNYESSQKSTMVRGSAVGIGHDTVKRGKAMEKEPLRPAVPPPDGIECCISCGTRESPEWRKSENGIKNLCNACGLKLARLQAKREGKQKPRKKKTTSAASSPSAPGPGVYHPGKPGSSPGPGGRVFLNTPAWQMPHYPQ